MLRFVMRSLSFFILLGLCQADADATKKMPPIDAPTIAGGNFHIEAAHIKKPTLIVFWATWCASCRHEIPPLKTLFKQHGKEIDIISISLDQDLAKLRTFVQNAGIEYPTLVDAKGVVADAFGIEQTPALFAIDKKGTILKESAHIKDLEPLLLELTKTRSSEIKSITRDAVVMGTEFSAVVLSEDEDAANKAIDAAIFELRRVEDLMTDWRESELMQVNQWAGKKPVKLSAETIRLLLEAQKASELTKGIFDISYAPLGALWDYTKPHPKPPSTEAIKKAMALVDYRQLQIDEKNSTAFLKKEGMRIGLGGIAKGYAIGRAAQLIKNLGFENFAIKAGGDMAVHGTNNGKLWNVVIRDPRKSEKNFALIPISNGAVSTSGDYERFFMYKGKRYAHIIDPRSGQPADACQSVTIITRQSVWADVLSKTVFILGPEEGMKFIEKLDDVEGVIVDAKGHVLVSSGLQKSAAKH